MQPIACRWETGKSLCRVKTIQTFELAAFMTFYRLLMGTQHTVSLVWAWSGLEFRRWGEGKKNAIIPLDLMLNQWHFKGNQGGSCQAVFMSCSEKEAPRWRSLCWKQRYEHFSISLLLLFWVSFCPVFSSAPHLFSTANAVCRSPSACQQQARAPGRHPEPQSVLDPLLWAVSDSTVSSSPSCPQGSCAKAFPFYG